MPQRPSEPADPSRVFADLWHGGRMGNTGARRIVAFVAFALAVACGTQPAEQAPAPVEATAATEVAGALRLYTTVTQNTVDAVVQAFAEQYPEVDVEVFRAPTGELTARVAAEQREGGVQAELLWLTDPLSMEQYESQDLFSAPPDDAVAAVDPRFASDGYVGTRLLNMVVVHGVDVAPPQSWADLAAVDADAPVALPDPGFAGSALGALGYFAMDDAFGLGFYEQLKASGAVQVNAPDEVTTGVAEGRFSAGMTLDNSARTAAQKGSPVAFVAPEPGAIAISSPIGVVANAANEAAGRAFVSFVVGEPAQEAIASTGWEPIRDDVAWPHAVPQVFPDWEAIAEGRDELLEEYRVIFGG